MTASTERPVGLGRLTRRAEFLAVASGRRFHTERMTVQGRRRSEAERPGAGLRLGLTVTRKVGHATERNRIRRRLRQAARVALQQEAGSDVDVVVIARRKALSAAFADLICDLERAARAVVRPKAGPSRPFPAPAHP